MNVLISSGFRWWNAEAAYAATLAALLREAGHGAHVAAPPGTRNAEELVRRGLNPTVAVHPAGLDLLRWPGDAARLLRFLRRERIDVVDVFRSAEFPLMAWAAHRVPGVRLIRTRGGTQPERAFWLNRKLYGDWCDGVIACCELIRARLQSSLRVPPEMIRTIYYPVEVPPLSAEAERESFRARLGRELNLESGRPLLAVVGRIAPEKGHEPLLEALQAVAQALPRVVLLIANKADPGEAPHRARLERSIAARGLAPWVRWLGFRDDVRRVMTACDLGVIPSVHVQQKIGHKTG